MRTQRFFRFVGALLAVLASAQSPAAAPPLLTLADALTAAQKNNPQILVASLDVHKAAEETSQLKTQRLPVVKLYANVGESLVPINLTIPRGALGVFPATGPVPAAATSIQTPRQVTGIIYGSAGQPLSELFKIHLALNESHLAEQAAKEKLRQQVADTSQQVRQSYYQIVQIQTQIASAQVTLDYLKELAAFTDRNLAQETVLKSDSLSVKAKLSQQQFQLLALQDRYDRKR